MSRGASFGTGGNGLAARSTSLLDASPKEPKADGSRSLMRLESVRIQYSRTLAASAVRENGFCRTQKPERSHGGDQSFIRVADMYRILIPGRTHWPFRNLAPAHSWQHHIRKQQVDISECISHRDSTSAQLLGGKNCVSLRSEQGNRKFTHRGIVLDKENPSRNHVLERWAFLGARTSSAPCA